MSTVAQALTVPRRAFVQQIMGMPISIHVKSPQLTELAPQLEAAVERCFAELREVDAYFSAWKDDSVLMRARRGEVDPTGDAWWRDIVGLCTQASEITDGLFTSELPSPTTSPTALPVAHYDPTGLVKGWAVQRVSRHLTELDEASYSVAAGGDLVVGGRVREAPAWRVGIDSPYVPNTIAEVVELRDAAIATSGSAARGAHIIDPRTRTAITRPGSVSVIGPDLTWADVWATAIYVDVDRGLALLAERAPDYRAIVV